VKLGGIEEFGRLIYDPMKDAKSRRQKRGNALLGVVFSLGFGSVLFVFLWSFAGGSALFESFPLAMIGAASMLAFGFVFGLIFLASSIRHDHFRVYENGIKYYRGFLTEVVSIPFKSMSKVHTNVRDYEGDPTDIVVLELRDGKYKPFVFLYDDDYIDLDNFLKAVGRKARIDSEPLQLFKIGVGFVNKKGRLVYEEHPRLPLPSSTVCGLWDVVLGRTFTLVALTGVFLFLIYLLASGTSHLGIQSTLVVAIVVVTIAHQLLSGWVHGAQSVKVYERGIELPTTWFERVFLHKGYVEWGKVGAVFTVRNSVVIGEKILRDVENQIVLVTKNGRTYNSSLKDEREVKRIMGAISVACPQHLAEEAGIEQLRGRRASFSNWLASLDHMSLIVPTVILDAFLIISLGVSIWAEADVVFIGILVLIIVLVDLTAGLLLVMASRAKREILRPESMRGLR
jgi:hypothetical protein